MGPRPADHRGLRASFSRAIQHNLQPQLTLSKVVLTFHLDDAACLSLATIMSHDYFLHEVSRAARALILARTTHNPNT